MKGSKWSCFVLLLGMALAGNAYGAREPWEPPEPVRQPAPKFAVLSDPHFYDTDLGATGSAFETYLAHDRKMLRESEALLESAISGVLAEGARFVLISGDLTKDGSEASHLKLADHLRALENNGVAVYVIPGNHDINNPHAAAYEGDRSFPVKNVTPEEFSDIYEDFGYDEALMRDPNSLSYVAEPAPGVWVLAIDSCKYEANLDTGRPETSGAIKKETLGWVLGVLVKAEKQHKTVIGLMHHGLVEHFKGQGQMFPDYLIDNRQEVARTLAEAGLKTVFTGHFHANDITASSLAGEDGEKTIFDMETGSLVTWPSPYRVATLHEGNALAVESRFITSIDYDTAGKPFQDYAHEFLLTGLERVAAFQLALPPEQGGYGLSAAEAAENAPHVAAAFAAHYAGDEAPSPETLALVHSYLGSPDPRFQGLGKALASLWTDLRPADTSGVLELNPAISLEPLATFKTGVFDASAAEIVAHDPLTQTLFVSNSHDNSIDMLDINEPSNPVQKGSIDLSPYGAGPNSVAVRRGLVAVAVESSPRQEPGLVVFFNRDGEYLNKVTVGALPDMITFTPDGRYLLAANEGEPNDDYSVDPEGSVSVIDLGRGVKRAVARTASFRRFNDQIESLRAAGIRIFGPGATVAQDLEPEYIAVSADSRTAWITLQENNAIAELDTRKAKITALYPLGFKNHGLPGNGLDASNKDKAIKIRAYHNLFGMYQPDAVAAFTARGRTYLVTANEGDGRDYEGFSEESKVSALRLDPKAFPDAATLQDKKLLGNLKVTNTLGDTDGDGDFDALYSYGARSFSILGPSAEGMKHVFDSGDLLEKITAAAYPADFNSDNDENGSFDSRSDNKGPEPEGLALGTIQGRTFVFLGLERIGGVMVWEVTDPRQPVFVQYLNTRNFSGDPATGTAGDLGPEGLTFIPARRSPSGKPLLAVANEVSGSTTLFRVNVQGLSRRDEAGEHGRLFHGHAGRIPHPFRLGPGSRRN